MSSIPVQFLIHVLPTPKCSDLPLFEPITDCLEAQIGIEITFDLYAQNSCDSDISYISDIIITTSIHSINYSLLQYEDDYSYTYRTFVWTPQLIDIGPQQICATAFTRFHFISFHLNLFILLVNMFNRMNIVLHIWFKQVLLVQQHQQHQHQQHQ